MSTTGSLANLPRRIAPWLIWAATAPILGAQEPSIAGDGSAPRPNVVIIFMDDMGYADIGPFGGGVATPHLDQMAAQGRRFTNFVVSSAVCSASRAALMTGCLHRRVGISGALMPDATIGINPDETTLAELCRGAGYETACFGKWHLGHHPKFLPTRHGFDHYSGIPYSNDMWQRNPQHLAALRRDGSTKPPFPTLPWIEGDRVTNPDVTPQDQSEMTRRLTRSAVDFIKTPRDRPFLLYLPHPMVHVPLYVGDEFAGQSGAGLFGDVVMEIDWSVGQLIDAIESIGATEQTLIVFTSDNGPWLSFGKHAGSAGPLREGKGTMWEGGYREPTLMRWPGVIPAGTTCDQLAGTIDLLPTIAALAGAALPQRVIDGKDIGDLLRGVAGATSPHEAFPCYYGNGQLQAIRDNRFKLVFPHRYRTLAAAATRDDGFPVDYVDVDAPGALYDLQNDIGETTDVTDQHPDVVARLTAAAERVRSDLGDKLTGVVGTGTRPPGKLSDTDPRLQW